MNKRLETLEEKFEGNMKYSHVGLSEKDNINCIRNEKVRLGMKHNSRYQFWHEPSGSFFKLNG